MVASLLTMLPYLAGAIALILTAFAILVYACDDMELHDTSRHTGWEDDTR